MAFHLGSLGFLTPFKFESYKTEVTKVFEGKLQLFLDNNSFIGNFLSDRQFLGDFQATQQSLCAVVWRWRWWRTCFREQESSRTAEGHNNSRSTMDSFLMDTPTLMLAGSPCSYRFVKMVSENISCWTVYAPKISLLAFVFLFRSWGGLYVILMIRSSD